MSSYLFQDAKIGDVVELDGHQLEVKKNKGHCPQCFFHKRICSGVACLSWEREEGTPAYYKEKPHPRPLPRREGSTQNKCIHQHPSPNTQQP